MYSRSAHMSDSGINKVYSNLLMPRFASRAAYNDHVLDFLHGLMITQQQPDRVSNPMYDLIDSGLLGFLGESVLFGNIYAWT